MKRIDRRGQGRGTVDDDNGGGICLLYKQKNTHIHMHSLCNTTPPFQHQTNKYQILKTRVFANFSSLRNLDTASSLLFISSFKFASLSISIYFGSHHKVQHITTQRG